MARSPTVYDVAERAGVSIATVSFTFRRPDRVRKSTRDAVLAAASALGYVPSANARGLATGTTGAIGLYSFDYLPEPAPASTLSVETDIRRFPLYVDEVQYGVEQECRQRGYAVMIGAARNPGHLPTVIDIAGRVDGLIALADCAPPEAILQVSKRIPVVELGGEARSEDVHTVLVDNHDGMRTLTAHLIEAHGFGRFAYLGAQGTAEFAERYQGFADALAAAGLPVPEPVRSHPAELADTAAAVARILATGPLPEALVCSTDQEALVVVDTLADAGVDVPARVAVTGFDGILAGRLATPRLTTVRQPMAEIGRTAVRILAAILDGSVDPGYENRLLPATFVPGSSCGCAPP